MNVSTTSGSKPTVLIRLHNYNRVSFGALLGACPDELFKSFHLRIWESDQAFNLHSLPDRTLFLFSYMMPHEEQTAQDVQIIRDHLQQSGNQGTLLAGGALVTADPKRALGIGFDTIFPGEGEAFFPEFLSQWLKDEAPSGILSSPATPVDLDRFPGFHQAIGYLPPIEISRGCIFGCGFCQVPRLHHGRVRHRSVEQISAIARTYLEMKPGRKRIKFLASNAFAYGSIDGRTPNLQALKSLLSSLKEAGVAEINFGSFPSEVRPDFVTAEVLDLVKPYISNRTIVMGVQTAHDWLLKEMHRSHTVADSVKAIQLLRSYGFMPHVDFIIGCQGETWKDQAILLTFMEEMVQKYGVRIHMHTFVPLPGTPWADREVRSISPEARLRLKALSDKGVLDGWWENQIAYSRKKK